MCLFEQTYFYLNDHVGAHFLVPYAACSSFVLVPFLAGVLITAIIYSFSAWRSLSSRFLFQLKSGVVVLNEWRVMQSVNRERM